jgi:ABC-type uncharacterized transport system permease subunit
MLEKIISIIEPFLATFIPQVLVSALVVGFIVGKIRDALVVFFPKIEENNFYRSVILQFLPMIIGSLGCLFLAGPTGFWAYGLIGGAISGAMYSYVKTIVKKYLENNDQPPAGIETIAKILGVKLPPK